MRTPLLCLFAFPLFAQGWVDRTPTNPAATPPSRAFPAMCWDAAHNYVLMYGGEHHWYPNRTDTWTWDGTIWTRRPTTAPMAGGGILPGATAMAFDATSGTVVLITYGYGYTWTGSDWFPATGTLSNGTGTPCNLAMAHDPVRNQTIAFVGSRGSSDVGETWIWAGTTWIERTPAVPPYPCRFPSMAFDPVAGRIVLTTTGNGQAGYFEWNGTNWQQRFPATMPTASGAMTTDTGNQRIVMLDGVLQNNPGHTWALHNGTATPVASAMEPARRLGAAMAFDPIRGRAVLFGGTSVYTYPTAPGMFPMGDTWEFTLGAAASYSTFGSGCAGSRGVVSLGAQGGSTPRIGQTFDLHIGNLPLTGPAFLFLGISNTNYGPTALPFSLGALGAPTCSILASGDELSVLTNVLGTAVWQRTMPAFPGLVFYNQAFALDPTANTLGLTASNGGRGTVGF
ncbi:MAG: hypothetical protein IPK26_19920 [Planctomycetes bacterium]|nr:hypothetical protein [Planctomycetota bacterium]